MNISNLIRPSIKALDPYYTARDECGENRPEIFLDANESPYDNGINRYPDPRQKQLKAKIAAIKGISPNQLFLGNGSDEAIDLMYRIFCAPGEENAVLMAPSYGMYEVAAGMNDVAVRKVQLKQDFSLDVDGMLSAADSRTKLMFVCSPNNPTGNSFPQEDIEKLLRGFGGAVVLDEAYIDFSNRGTLVPLIEKYPNLVVLQTLSKAWGMAGLRIGLAIAMPEIVATMNKVKYPYNINILAQKMALTKLDEDAKNRRVAEIIGDRFRVEKALAESPKVQKIYPSDSNFILVKVTDPEGLYAKLLQNGIIVRNRSQVKGCEGCLRITIGAPFENDRLLDVLGVGPGKDRNGVERLGERHVRLTRKTKETSVSLELDLDKGGISEISTGLDFFDHMLEQIPHHGGVSLRVKVEGDLQVDDHHTIEDTGIALGEAINAALGDKMGIARYGFVLPMDDCDAAVLMDFGGRTDFQWKAEFHREKVGAMSTEMFRHFFQSACTGAKCNLHIEARGGNEHHKAEAIFKGFARTLRMAAAKNEFPYEIPSSKGIL